VPGPTPIAVGRPTENLHADIEILRIYAWQGVCESDLHSIHREDAMKARTGRKAVAMARHPTTPDLTDRQMAVTGGAEPLDAAAALGAAHRAPGMLSTAVTQAVNGIGDAARGAIRNL